MKKIIGLFMLMMGIAGLAGASVIFNDTTGFVNWYKGTTGIGGAGNLTKGDDLNWVEAGSNGQEAIGRAFTATTIAVGETLRLSFDYTQSLASPTIVRAGFMNISGTLAADGWAGTSTTAGSTLGTYSGYYAFLRDNSTATCDARREGATATGYNTTPLGGGAPNTIAAYADQYDIVDDGTKTYQAVYELTRNSATAMAVSFALYDGATKVQEISGSRDNADIVTGFNSVFFRVSGGRAVLDNIQVSVIPEPATLGMLGLGALITLSIRRKIIA